MAVLETGRNVRDARDLKIPPPGENDLKTG